MKTIKKIVCAVDLAPHSTAVADYAAAIATSFDAEVLVLYVAPSLSQYVGFHVPPSSIENFVGEIVQGAEKNMETFVVEKFNGIKATSRIVTGYAAEEILSISEEYKADLVIMGTHGRRGIDRILFGSVAEKVVKNSSIPVMTIRPQS